MNADRVVADIRELDESIERLVAPVQEKPFVVFHDGSADVGVWGRDVEMSSGVAGRTSTSLVRIIRRLAVELDHLAERDARRAQHLPRPGDARFHLELGVVMLLIERHLSEERRARPDERQVATWRRERSRLALS